MQRIGKHHESGGFRHDTDGNVDGGLLRLSFESGDGLEIRLAGGGASGIADAILLV